MKLDMFFITGRGYPVMRWAALALFASILVMTGIPAARATGDHAGDHSSEDDSSTTQLKSHKAQLQAELAQASGEPPALQKMVRDGVVVEFQVIPDKSVGKIQEGRLADVEFRISDAATGNPIKGIYPAVWLDIAKSWEQRDDTGGENSCRERVQLYMQGLVGARPLVDLNSYFVLVMNQNASISVIDPLISVSGMTKLYEVINLLAPGAEWTRTRDEKRMYVSMPAANKIALIDLDTFTVKTNIDAGQKPLRLALQPDEKYLWVANNHNDADLDGVSIIDVATGEKVGFVATGGGHHELAFSHDSRYAYVSNRNAGTVTVIDTARRATIKTLEIGKQVIGLVYSAKSEALYATDGKSGLISVIDAKTNTVSKRIEVKPGVGPAGVTQLGRWMIAANSHEDVIYAIDVATNELVHTIEVGRKPYQVAFSRAFVYVRSLGTERVSMVEIAHLDSQDRVIAASFPAGTKAPGETQDLSLASVIYEAPGEAAVLVVSPSDNTVYYHMEGMNSPMGNFANEGYRPRAVTVADRTLGEDRDGVYRAKVRIPAAGTYDVAFLMESPSLVHCFSMSAARDPSMHVQVAGIEFIDSQFKVNIEDEVTLKFRITNPETGEHITDLKDVRVRYYRAPAFDRREKFAIEVGDGVYQLDTELPNPGLYYFFVSSKSSSLGLDKQHFVSVMATRPRVETN